MTDKEAVTDDKGEADREHAREAKRWSAEMEETPPYDSKIEIKHVLID